MKKTLLISIAIIVVLVIAFWIIFSNQNNSAPATTINTGNPSVNTTSTTTAPSSSTPSTNGTSTSASSGYKDGMYTGSLADAIYGKLQLAVTISAGKITNITWPIYPNDGGHSIQVSNSALPVLEQEAITSQSANVNIVSGATQTSQAFQQSLAAALSQAQS